MLRCHAATSRIVRVVLAVAHLSHGPRVLWSATARQGAAIEVTYEVRLRRDDDALALVAELNALEGVQNVELRRE